MILTFKVKHNNSFSLQLKQAKQIAEFAVKNKFKLTSKHVKHFGLKSAIAGQILRKYGNNKKIKQVASVKLIVDHQNIKLDIMNSIIKIIPLKLSFSYQFRYNFSKVNQIEIDNNYYYVSVTVPEQEQIKTEGWLGIDRNTNGHCLVAACTKTNKVLMLGKQCKHIHTKYSNIRKKLQRLNKLQKLKVIKRRESNIVKDINHKISSKVVKYAKTNSCGIKLENLKGIRRNKNKAQSFKYTLNSWSYYQLQQFIEYKAKMLGISVLYIDPAYTSQICHKCGLIGNRKDKSFKCPHCGYTSHADTNAAWNIANTSRNIANSEKLLAEPKPEYLIQSGSLSEKDNVYSQRSVKEGDLTEGKTDIPLQAPVLGMTDLKTSTSLA